MRLAPMLPGLRRPAVGCATLTAACILARLPLQQPLLRLVAGGAAGATGYLAVVLPGSPALDRAKALLVSRVGRAPS
jgi:hypothetical protein